MLRKPPDFVYGDPLPDAPELAHRGPHAVGVRTVEVVNPRQFDVLAAGAAGPPPRYDRPLTIEIFYPGTVPSGEQERTVYRDVLGLGPDNPARPNTPFTFAGRALRGAAADRSGAPYPLVVLSHGYPGSRFMMTNLAENLASKGYLVAAIAHTESTFDNALDFTSTLVNRARDQLFTIDELARRSAAGDGFLSGLLEPDNAAIIGYSMGGYGALNAAGAGYAETMVALPVMPTEALQARQAGTVVADPRVRALVAIAPWGGPAALAAIGSPGASWWDPSGLAGLAPATLFIAGSDDDISGYEGGVKWLFEHAVNAERYLLVYRHARHNIAANPPPAAAWGQFDEYARYADFVWDVRRINNINQHLITAMLGLHLKGEPYRDYLEGPANGRWTGFPERTAVGLDVFVGR